jgi:hypothetical protein
MQTKAVTITLDVARGSFRQTGSWFYRDLHTVSFLPVSEFVADRDYTLTFKPVRKRHEDPIQAIEFALTPAVISPPAAAYVSAEVNLHIPALGAILGTRQFIEMDIDIRDETGGFTMALGTVRIYQPVNQENDAPPPVLPPTTGHPEHAVLWIKNNVATWVEIVEFLGEAKGDTGVTGAQGVKGDTGTAGVAGDTGAGTQGDTGVKGDTGTPGSAVGKGDTGDQGDTGAAGAKGDTGSAGAAGAAGAKGDTGTAGSKGDTGSDGNAGSKGDTGTAGAKGDTGTAGAAGAQGEAGTAGAKGDTGSSGAAGAKGDTGTAGASGTQGDTGAAGAAGVAGAKGDTGSAGSDGAKGDTGTQGDTGAGEKGDTGAASTEAGPKGDTGTAGTQGDTGSGIQGDTGIAGAKGDTGTQGDTGAGLQGDTGAQGDSGVSTLRDPLEFDDADLDENGVLIIAGVDPISEIRDNTGAGVSAPVVYDTAENETRVYLASYQTLNEGAIEGTWKVVFNSGAPAGTGGGLDENEILAMLG